MRISLVTAVAVGAFVGVVGAGRVDAHHSFAAVFDGTKAIRLTGTLVKVEWTNPHSYFYLEVKDDLGAVATWACEGASPAAFSRRGFKRSELALGEILVVDGYRARDGSNLIDARRVTLANGKIISGVSGNDGGPQ